MDARVVALCAVAAIAIAGWRIALAAEPLHWSKTEGRITQSAQTREFAGINIGRYSNSVVMVDRFHVKYSYDVGGQSYVGDRIDVLTREGHKYPLTGARHFPLGTAVAVRFDPRNPRRAVLEVNVPWGAVLTIVLAIGVMALALLPTGRRARKYRTPREPIVA
jgi:hypothetical protein